MQSAVCDTLRTALRISVRSYMAVLSLELFNIMLWWLGEMIKSAWLVKEGIPSITIGFSSVQSLSHVQLFATPWIAARQASLSITNSRSSLKLTSIESVMPSSHLILCRPLLLLSPIPPSIRVFSNVSTLCMRWPKCWSFSFSIIVAHSSMGDYDPIARWLN